MDLRLCFEPEGDMAIDNPKAFAQYGKHYLADYGAEFAGYIAMDERDKRHSNLQPVWQFILKNVDKDRERELIDYLNSNPINSYYAHVYEMHGAGRQTKVH